MHAISFEPLIWGNAVLAATPLAVLATLVTIAAFFFWLEQRTGWKLFEYLPPLIFIYFAPVALTYFAVLPRTSPVYDAIGELLLPVILVMLLLNIDVGRAVRVMGRGVVVMLFGTLGVVIGAPIGYAVVQSYLEPGSWKAFGILSGSWIGGTGNMAAMAEMLDEPAEGRAYALAVLADTTIYIAWLPLLLGSRRLADRFGRFTGVDESRVTAMEAAAADALAEAGPPQPATYRDHLYVLAAALLGSWAAAVVAPWLPALGNVVSEKTWRILLVTTFGIAGSFTPLRRLRGGHELAMALIYVFVARMGAAADLRGLASYALPFLAGASLWIVIHGLFCLLGARLLKVDVHTAAIASAANIGGAASAPIVAAHHRESLVPASILMALIGYAVGNYAALIAAQLCRWVAG